MAFQMSPTCQRVLFSCWQDKSLDCKKLGLFNKHRCDYFRTNMQNVVEASSCTMCLNQTHFCQLHLLFLFFDIPTLASFILKYVSLKQIHICTCMNCIYTIYTHIYVCVFVCVYAYMYICVHGFILGYMCTCIYMLSAVNIRQLEVVCNVNHLLQIWIRSNQLPSLACNETHFSTPLPCCAESQG